MKTFKIYLYTTVLLTTVTLLCITMLWCIYCITGNLYFWNTFTILPKSHPLPLATTNLFSISWVCLFSDPYVSETNHTVFVFLWCISLSIMSSRGFLHSSVSKESICNAGGPGSIPGSGRSPRKGNDNSIILVWEIPWTEEHGWLQSMGLQESDTTEQLNHHY